MRTKRSIVLMMYFLLPCYLWALPPVILVGAGAGGTWITDSGDNTNFYPYYNGTLSGTYRTALSRGGYFAGSLLTDLKYYTDGIRDLDDRYVLSLQLGAPIRTNRIEVNTRVDSSFHNAGAGYFLQPAWSADLLFSTDTDAFVPRLGYFGSYRHQEDALNDRFIQGARIGFDRDLSIYFGWGMEALGAWEYYPDWFVRDSAGEISDTPRQDVRIELSGTLEGLIGFFHSWDTSVTTGVLLSNTDDWVPESESRWRSGITGTLQLSPHRNIGIETSATVDNDYYLEREIDGDRVNRLGIDGGLRLDYTPDGALFFVLDANGGWHYSNDPLLEGWNTTISGGIEYSF